MQISDIVAEENGSILAQSLQFDNLSQEEFDATWLACTKFRLKQIAECKHVADITKLWPQYKQEN
ncbi:uncharacterized protein LOC142225876 isoform X2 [Haematobia irritans]|uniref:uncharacterized protein LOC142225876 isoform X2 n=1 Tax=Haematobia irritans TaxID=7368 RepID=UPI003F50A344